MDRRNIQDSSAMATPADARNFILRVRQALTGQEQKHDRFFQIMKDFKSGKITAPNVIIEMKSVLESHDDLILEFSKFLPENYRIIVVEDNVEAIDFVNSILIRFAEDIVVCDEFLNLLNLYKNGGKKFIEIFKSIAVLFKDHPDVIEKFSRFYCDKEKSIQEMTNRESLTPSYRLVPEFYQSAVWSCTSEIAAEVLNDQWLCLRSKTQIWNKHQADLERREDERFEIDMEIESLRSATKQAEKFLKEYHNNKNGDGALKSIDDYLSEVNLHRIKRSYWVNGSERMKLLKKSPMKMLPEIIERMKKKEKEWMKRRSDFEDHCIGRLQPTRAELRLPCISSFDDCSEFQQILR